MNELKMCGTKNTFVVLLLVVSVYLSGGFYSWSILLIGVGISMAVIVSMLKQDDNSQVSMVFIVFLLVFLLSVPVCFWAVDLFEHIKGLLAFLVVLTFCGMCSLMEAKERVFALRLAPYIGCSLICISILSLLIPVLRVKFWNSGRMGATFQYSNTCALYYLLGIIICLGFEKRDTDKDRYRCWSIIGILILGVLLTGSRGITLLLIGWGVYKSLKSKEFRKVFLITTAVLVSILYVLNRFVSGNLSVGRIFTLFSQNSTILGRILYMKDAVSILKNHLAGIGFGGYYYVQHSYQTGVYTTRFVHNDLLDFSLSIGLIPALIMIGVVIFQVFKGKQSSVLKETIVIAVLASTFDFHFQYLSIWMILVLCFDYIPIKSLQIKRRILIPILAVISFSYLYFFIPQIELVKGNADVCVKFYPDTEAELQILDNETDIEKAAQLANRIVKNNQYAKQPYKVLGYANMMLGNYAVGLEYMDKVITLDKYNIQEYLDYRDLLEDTLIYGNIRDDKTYKMISEKRNSLPEILSDLQYDTDPIAFLIKDKPVFSLE